MGREIKRTYRFRVYPNKEQRRELAQTFGCCRWVYNWALEKKKTAYHREEEVLSYTDLSSHLTEKKREEETQWLQDVSSTPSSTEPSKSRSSIPELL